MAKGAAGAFTPVPWRDATADTVLPLWVGVVVVLGFGAFFSIFTTILVYLDTRFAGTKMTSEQFNTAGRGVKTGLTAAVIVSQWTWAATLLQSSNVAWQYGVSGPFWYAAGASIQVLLFGVLAIEVKIKAPTAHTFLEIIKARWGTLSHIVFTAYGLLTCAIVTSMLLLGGAAVVNALTGLDLYLTSFLIPWGVVIYTFAGGLKATFLASYIHTAVIFIILVVFIYTVYATSPLLGDAPTLYAKLAQNVAFPTPTAAEVAQGFHSGPVDGNKGGSHLTMLSREGLFFGVINIVGNFGTVFLDQSYWQSAIAAKPASSHKGYMLGGLIWFIIPFGLATSLGLAATALNAKISPDEANNGLVPPASAIILLGQGGGVAMLITLFMAITSTGSAECIAVSSIVAYDIYRTYINPRASGAQILLLSRIVIAVYGIFMGVFAIVLFFIGLSLGWVYLFMGVLIGSAVVPTALCLLWSKANGPICTVACPVGTVLALIAWLVTAQIESNAISVATLGRNFPMLMGNVFALGSSTLIATIGSLIFPENYDFESMAQIPLVEEENYKRDADETDEKLTEARDWIVRNGTFVTLLLIVGWPVATVPWGVFSESIFMLWASVALMWGTVAAAIIILLPLWESREDLLKVILNMFGCKAAVPTYTTERA